MGHQSSVTAADVSKGKDKVPLVPHDQAADTQLAGDVERDQQGQGEQRVSDAARQSRATGSSSKRDRADADAGTE